MQATVGAEPDSVVFVLGNRMGQRNFSNGVYIMKVVLDTNVIVSAILIKTSNEHRILRAWQEGDFELDLSPQILEEMSRVLF